MAYKKTQTWGIALTFASFAAAMGVYILARTNPPALIEPFRATVPLLADQGIVFGSAPSLLYTLSIGLLIGIIANSRHKAIVHCLVWVLIACCLELSQHASIATLVVGFATDFLPDSIWQYLGPYWVRGSFDPFDLLATLVGGSIAVAALNGLPTEHNR